jgi:hypothetical protein
MTETRLLAHAAGRGCGFVFPRARAPFQRFCHTFLVLIALTLSAWPAVARDLYVNNTGGNDRWDGSAARRDAVSVGPVQTIARALRLASKGDRIILANTGQPYREAISLSGGDHWGLRNHPLTILGNGATLDGTAPVPPAWQHFRDDTFRFYPQRHAYQQLMLGTTPAPRRNVTTEHVLPPLTAGAWALLDGAIYFRVAPGKLPADYPLRHSLLQTGITLYDVRNVRIENLIVQGFGLDGINVHDGVRGAVISGVTCRTNGRSGISVGGTSQATIDHCRLEGNGQSQFRIEGLAKVQIDNTQIDAGNATKIQIAGGQLEIDGERVERVESRGLRVEG